MNQEIKNSDFYIDLCELSRRLSCSPRTIRDYISDVDNQLPAYKVRGKLLFYWPEVQAWVASHKIKTMDINLVIKEIVTELER